MAAQGRSRRLLGRRGPAQPSRFNEQPLSGTAELRELGPVLFTIFRFGIAVTRSRRQRGFDWGAGSDQSATSMGLALFPGIVRGLKTVLRRQTEKRERPMVARSVPYIRYLREVWSRLELCEAESACMPPAHLQWKRWNEALPGWAAVRCGALPVGSGRSGTS